MRRFRALVVAALATVTLTTATLAAATPAQAHPVAFLNCESGEGEAFCSVAVTQSFGPLTIRWYINNRARPEFNNQTDIWSSCPIGSYIGVRVVVTDLAGSDAVAHSVRCRAIFQ